MLGERLKALRKSRKMTQEDVAKALGLSKSTVGMYEQGRREPPYELLLKISELFGVSVDWLLAREQPETPAAGGDLDDLLAAFHRQLKNQEGLMFHGQPLDAGDIEKIVRAMRLGAELTLRESKEDELP